MLGVHRSHEVFIAATCTKKYYPRKEVYDEAETRQRGPDARIGRCVGLRRGFGYDGAEHYHPLPAQLTLSARGWVVHPPRSHHTLSSSPDICISLQLCGEDSSILSSMRIVAGELKGRIFDSPAGHKTHPMSEQIRGAIFNVLGDIEGLTVFDAFAGSGAVAFEAISRGAKTALLTDVTKEAYLAMKKNAQMLGVEKKAKVVQASASGWCDNNLHALFDLIVADPPYDDLQEFILKKLTNHLKLGGIYVLSYPGGKSAPQLPGLELVKSKDYGDAQLVFYKKQ